MCSLSGFRPPLFSEDDAWLPAWLQQCHHGQLNVEGSGKDNITFEQRVEEFQYLEKGMSIGESMRDEGECNISRLFISGSDSSPFSSAQLDDNVDQLRLCLSYDTGNSNDTTLTAGANWSESNGPLVIKALQNTTVISQKDAKLTMIPIADAVDWSPAGDLEKSAKENELLRRNIEIFSEDHVDAIELCVAASEALVINEAIESDKFIKPSASAILETSLQVKQARLELLTTFSSATSDDTIEMDSLSDLDDLIMESAYEDAGIYLDLLPGNKLSVSQVKDTFESESYDNLENDIKSSSAMSGGKSCNHTDGTEGVMVNEIQSRNDIAGDCVDVDMRKEVIFNPEGNLAVGVGDYDDCFRTIDEQARAHLSREAKKTTEDKSHETNSSFPIMRYQDGEKSNDVNNIVKERFQSRWLGGWTTNNEATCLTTAKHSIANPFAGETSFLSESADAPADENSVMQAYHHKATIIASQVSIPSENLLNRAKGGMSPSQDVVSPSSASLLDPLCSVVPCSISENVSQPVNHNDTVCPRHMSDADGRKEDNVLGPARLNNVAVEEETMAFPVANIKEMGVKCSRNFVSLRNYSMGLPRHTTLFKRYGHHKKSFQVHSRAEVALERAPFANEENIFDVPTVAILPKENKLGQSHVVRCRTKCQVCTIDCFVDNLAEENASQKASLPENRVESPTDQNLQQVLLQSKSRRSLLAPKRVQFAVKETSIPRNQKLRKVQTLSKIGSTRAINGSTRSDANRETNAQQMDRFLKASSNNEKKRLIFQNMVFLLTGFSQQKEKEIEGLIRKYGGIVLTHIPHSNSKGKRSSSFKHRILPIVLCMKKIQSLKFLYGCAVNASVLKVDWLIDSIAAGYVLPPKIYAVLFRNTTIMHDQVYTAVNYITHTLVFNNVGVMLHGKTRFFSNIATIIEHGGGQVFRTLQRLNEMLEAGRISMGVVVSDENCASRHLKQCAMEQNIPMTSVYWIIKCLYAGKLVPLEEKKHPPCLPNKLQMRQGSNELSQEI